ncbi:MAG: VCBS repeat-containing protein [Nannocystaceae bacterium]
MAVRWFGAMMLSLGVGACFDGEGTLGSICRDDTDCGDGQRCRTEVCGYCGDGIAQPGELCLVSAVALDRAPSAAGTDLLAVDLDGDASLDLVTRGSDGRPAAWTGGGDGSWTVATEATGVGLRGALRLARLDADDTLDIVVADDDAPALHLGYGDAQGGWSFVGAFALEAPALDLAVAGAVAGTSSEAPAWIAWVDDDGLMHARVEPVGGGLQDAVRLDAGRALRVGDPVRLDGDGALDLPVVDLVAMELEVWRGDGAGGLLRAEPIALPARPVDVVVADVDGDGDDDLLVPDEAGGVTVMTSDGEGGLSVLERPEVPGPARGVAVADLDRDSDRDLVVLAEADPAVWVLLGRGFRHPDAVAVPVDGTVGALLAIDGDRDGLVELVLGPTDGPGPLRVVEVAP